MSEVTEQELPETAEPEAPQGPLVGTSEVAEPANPPAGPGVTTTGEAVIVLAPAGEPEPPREFLPAPKPTPSEAPLTQSVWASLVAQWPDRATAEWLNDAEGRFTQRQDDEVAELFEGVRRQASQIRARHARRLEADHEEVPA